MTLQRLIITFKPDELVLHALYRTQDGPGPNTRARRREVTELTKSGLTQALESLDGEGGVDVVGTNGFRTREDVLWAKTPPDADKLVKGACFDDRDPGRHDRAGRERAAVSAEEERAEAVRASLDDAPAA